MMNSELGKSSWGLLKFLQNLFTIRWRSLLILLTGIFFSLLIFEQLAVATWQNSESFSWDKSLLLKVHAIASPTLDRFVPQLTKLGVFWGVFPVTLVVSLILFRQQRWRSLIYLITAILGSWLLCHTAKILLHRERPHIWESILPLDYSFPSGHAMSSMTLVVALVVLTWGSRWCKWVLLTGTGYVLVIGWTRLYLGVHFPSDVLAGWMASIAWTVGVSLLINPHAPRLSSEEKTTLTESLE
jgi:membrane-associated phospholipid phosphatase